MIRIIWFIFLISPLLASGQMTFSDYFLEKSMRFDFLLGGNAREVTIYPQQIREEPHYAGSQSNLIDTLSYGTCRFRLFDPVTERELFRKGFNTLFQEWQTTAGAKEMNRAFYQSVVFPFPLKIIRLEIDARQWDGSFETIYETLIDPDDHFIIREDPFPFETVTIMENGKPSKKVDIVILADGYTRNEMDKFVADARRVTKSLFETEPFRSEKVKFNVRAVLTPSVDSGTDIPGEGIFRNTIFNSTFYTFNLPRYLTVNDVKSVYDAAAVVPYDHICVLVNSEQYGGGGFYNFLSVCTTDNRQTHSVFIHEFGHSFAGLGDEYYDSAVAYENYYNTAIEPWEPNLTTLVDFDSKWKIMVADSVPVPTPRNNKFINKVGVFEGGGYMAKGIYSPFMNCRMKSNNADEFCPVCIRAIREAINFHCD